MSIILLTHPRSGSTKITKCISAQLNIKNLGEFFYLRNSLNYGEIRFYDPQFRKSLFTYKMNNGSLDRYNLMFDTPSAFQNFLLDECQNRIDYLNSLNGTFIFKHFFDDKISRVFYETVKEKALSNINYNKIYLYRRNIVEAILSLMIKDIFINRRSTKLTDIDFNSVGHNYGSMQKLYPSTRIEVSNRSFESYSTMFVNFFQNLKHIKNPVKLCYEDIFDQGSFVVNENTISLDLDPELPMDYGVDKKDFFKNYDQMIDHLNRIAKNNGLIELFSDLGIIYE